MRYLVSLLLSLFTSLAFAGFAPPAEYKVTEWNFQWYGSYSLACSAALTYLNSGATFTLNSCTETQMIVDRVIANPPSTITAYAMSPIQKRMLCPGTSDLVGSECVCKQGLVQSGNSCVDPSTCPAPNELVNGVCQPPNKCASFAGTSAGNWTGKGSVGSKSLCYMEEDWTKPPKSGDPANPGCLITGEANFAGDYGNGYVWSGALTYSGASCTPTASAPGTGSTTTSGSGSGGGSGTTTGSSPTPCTPPKVPGTVNGVTVCYEPNNTNGTTSTATGTNTTPNNGTGTGVTTQTQVKVECNATTCTKTTTVTTGTTSPGGTFTPSSTDISTTTCQKSDPSCSTTATASGGSSGTGTSTTAGGGGGGDGDGDSSSFGGACEAGFTCSGDAIQCAIAQDQHRRSCQLMDKVNPVQGALFDAAAALPAGSVTAGLSTSFTTNIDQSKFDTSDAIGGGSAGMVDKTITVAGSSITLPFSTINPYLAVLGNLLMAVGFLLAARIVSRG